MISCKSTTSKTKKEFTITHAVKNKIRTAEGWQRTKIKKVIKKIKVA